MAFQQPYEKDFRNVPFEDRTIADPAILNQQFRIEPLIRGRRAVEVDVNDDEGYAGGDETHLSHNTLFRRVRHTGQTSMPITRASPQPTITYHIENQFGEHSIHNSAPIAHHRVLPSYPISDEVYFGHKT